MTWPVVNPHNLEIIGEVTLVDWPQIDQWIGEAQHLHNRPDARVLVYERIAILKRAAAIMEDRFESLARQISREGGKPIVDARIETRRAIQGLELCVHELFGRSGREVPMDLTETGSGRRAYTFSDPIGPVVAISAFNHPLNLIVHQVGPAVAVGCPVLVKPATETPLSCQRLVDILYEAGLEEKWCRFAPCEDAVAERMATDPRTAFLTFIGSARVGWMLRSKVAPGTRVALEHGGAAPVIIDRDVAYTDIIPALLKGGFYHSGQVCVSVQRVFVPQDKLLEFSTALASGADALIIGDPLEEETQCGPLIRPHEVDRIQNWIDEAVTEGATLMSGGERVGQTFYKPTVLMQPSYKSKVSTSEIFGPVICVYGYDNLDDAIVRANALPYAFQGAVFTDRLSVADHCVEKLNASAVMINDHTAFRVDWMPFAGQKQSGLGTGGIRYTMNDMSEDKLVVFKK